MLHDAHKRTAAFTTWEQLRDLWRPGEIDFHWHKQWASYKWQDIDHQATDACMDFIQQEQPDFAFLYLGETDEYGHRYGWLSPEYLGCVARAGDDIIRITKALPEEYQVIVTADHGGHGRNHGETIPEDMTIPLCFRGSCFRQGEKLQGLTIMDIAPTITQVLGVEADEDWDGKSIV